MAVSQNLTLTVTLPPGPERGIPVFLSPSNPGVIYRSISEKGQSVNKEYLSQIQFYSIFSELPVTSNMVVIITVCVKVANSTGFPQIKAKSGLIY